MACLLTCGSTATLNGNLYTTLKLGTTVQDQIHKDVSLQNCPLREKQKIQRQTQKFIPLREKQKTTTANLKIDSTAPLNFTLLLNI